MASRGHSLRIRSEFNVQNLKFKDMNPGWKKDRCTIKINPCMKAENNLGFY